MKRRECLTMLGMMAAGLKALMGSDGSMPTGKPSLFTIFDGSVDYLSRSDDLMGYPDSKVIEFWFSDGVYYDLSTAEGRIAALNAARRGR